MIEPMYKVEHRGFREYSEKSNGPDYDPNGVIYENFSGTYIAHFIKTEANEHTISYFFGMDCVEDNYKTQDLSKLCRHVWKKYWESLSYTEKFTRRFFAHRAWIAALITSVIASAITLGVSKLF